MPGPYTNALTNGLVGITEQSQLTRNPSTCSLGRLSIWPRKFKGTVSDVLKSRVRLTQMSI
jgi:hypothetical protein